MGRRRSLLYPGPRPDPGELCDRCATSDAVDAVVVVSAAQRGDSVLTSDPGDLVALAAHLPQPPLVIAL